MKLEQFKQQLVAFEEILLQQCQSIEQNRLKDSMLYSLSSGGKRVRPLLLLACLKAFDVPIEKGYDISCAIEFVHTYSLIHDDLPAMDNDDFRRGQLTNHKQFDEATAILSGDALLTDAFSIILKSSLTHEQKCDMALMLSSCAGSIGMIAGQMMDIASENKTILLEQLQNIHHLKTGKLLQFCVYAASKIIELDNNSTQQFMQFATHYGLAFQIHNDLLDVKQDEKLQKSTYVSILGVDGAKKALQVEIDAAKSAIKQLKQYYPQFDDQLIYDFLQYVTL